jgi:hypothetical protein
MTLRTLVALSSAAAATAVSVLFGAPAAQAVTPDVFTFSDPFGDSFDCPGFPAEYSGHDRGRVTTYFDGDGTPTRQEGHIHATETDTNLRTGESIVVRSNLTVHAQLDADGKMTTWSFTGEIDVSTRSGDGIILHDSGFVGLEAGDPEPIVTVLHGFHDTFTKDDAFCDALS